MAQVTAVAAAKAMVRVTVMTAVTSTPTLTLGIGGATLGISISTPPFRATGRNGQRKNGRHGRRSRVALRPTMPLTQKKRFA